MLPPNQRHGFPGGWHPDRLASSYAGTRRSGRLRRGASFRRGHRDAAMASSDHCPPGIATGVPARHCMRRRSLTRRGGGKAPLAATLGPFSRPARWRAERRSSLTDPGPHPMMRALPGGAFDESPTRRRFSSRVGITAEQDQKKIGHDDAETTATKNTMITKFS
jgi:hypothetical protein